MEFWQSTIPLTIHEVQYEQFVKSPEQETRNLLDFLGLDFNQACLKPEISDRVVRTISFTQVRKPVNTDAVKRVDRYQDYLGPLREALAN